MLFKIKYLLLHYCVLITKRVWVFTFSLMRKLRKLEMNY